MAPTFDTKETLVQVDRQGFPVDVFMVHETVGSYPGDLNWLVGSGQVSSNWYIRRDGKLYLLSERACGHAGVGTWQGDGKQTRVINGNVWGEMNLRSEGVELEGRNDGTPFTPAQVATLRDLILWRCEVKGIRADRVIRHMDYAPGRKTDPQGLDWRSFTGALWPDHTQVQRPPTCTLGQFRDVLQRWNSPALPEASTMFDAMVRYGIDPSFGIAVFEHESSCGTAGKAQVTRNMGNVRNGVGRQVGSQLGFAQYKNWTDGAADWSQIIRDRYGNTWGLYTVERIIPTYAPSSDGNAPTSYISAVLDRMGKLAGTAKPVGDVLRQTTIGGLEGREYECSKEFKSFYDKNGGLLVFGYPLGDQHEAVDTEGELCQYMMFENAWLKKKPSMPESWRLRPCSLLEISAMSSKTGGGQ